MKLHTGNYHRLIIIRGDLFICTYFSNFLAATKRIKNEGTFSFRMLYSITFPYQNKPGLALIPKRRPVNIVSENMNSI